MQPLTAPPRDSLTAAQVAALITGPALSLSTGLELLGQDLTVTADISDQLLSGKVSRNCDATIHGTCSLQLSQELVWGTALVRPYLMLGAARFDLGVFSLATPERSYAESPVTFDCTGYDRLYLLSRQVGDSYSVAAGTDVLTAVRQAITDAGLSGLLLDGTASGTTLPSAMVWPLLSQDSQPATWLRVVNDLLATVGYRGMWADWDGRFRSEPYADPASRGVEWVLDEDAASTVQGEDRSLVMDNWQQPNKWIFVQQTRADGAAVPSEGDGIYTVDESAGDPRGVWPTQVTYDAASQASLVSLGDQRVAADKRRTSTWTLRGLGPLPTVWHFDVLSLVVGGVTHKVQGAEWQMDLVSGLVDYTLTEVGGTP